MNDRWAVVLHDLNGDPKNRVPAVSAGAIVLVNPKEGSSWWTAKVGNTEGFLPKNYLQLKPIDWDPSDLVANQALVEADALESDSDDSDSLEIETPQLLDSKLKRSTECDHEQIDDLDGSMQSDSGKIGRATLVRLSSHELVPAKALFDFEASKSQQLSFRAEETLWVKPSDASWWAAESGGQAGLVPYNYVEILSDPNVEEEDFQSSDSEDGGDKEEEESRADTMEDTKSMAICRYDFQARGAGELSFAKGDFVWVNCRKGAEWWVAQNERREKGMVPRNYLKVVKLTEGDEPTTPEGNYRNELRTPAICLKEIEADDPSASILNLLFFRLLSERVICSTEAFLSMIRDREIFQLLQYDQDEVLHSGGDSVDALFIVVQGKCLLDLGHGSEWPIPAGAWIGDVFVLEPHFKLPQLRTCEPTAVLKLDHKGLSRLEQLYADIHEALIELASFRSAQCLRSVKFASGLDGQAAATLCALLSFRAFRQNEILFRSGESQRQLFILVSGEAHVPEENLYLNPGESIGEESLISGFPRQHSAVVTKPAIALVLEAEGLAMLLQGGASRQLSIALSSFVWKKSVDSLRRIPLFASVPFNKLEEISSICRHQTFSSDEAIIKAGEEGQDLYIIESGVVRVEMPPSRPSLLDSKGAKPNRPVVLGPGSYFGEIAILHRVVRSATVTVEKGPCRCVVLGGPAFRTFLSDCPQLKRIVVETLSKRLQFGQGANKGPRSSLSLNDAASRTRFGGEFQLEGARSFDNVSIQSENQVPTNEAEGVDSAREAASDFESPPQQWIIGSVESLSALPGDFALRDQESIDARTVWQQVGMVMRACHALHEGWPSFVVPTGRTDLMAPSGVSLLVTVLGLDSHVNETTLRTSTDSSVGYIVERAFLNVENAGRRVDRAGPECFALKVHGKNDFLIHRNIPLRQYKHVAKLCRRHANVYRLSVALVDLRVPPTPNGSGLHALKFSSEKKSQSQPGARKDHLDASPEERGPDVDGSDCEDNEYPRPDNGSCSPPDLPGLPPLSPEQWSNAMLDVTRRALAVRNTLEEVNRENQMLATGSWPLRVKVVGLENTHNLERIESRTLLCLRIELVYANRTIETMFSKAFKPEGYTIRIQEWIWFSSQIAKLPLTTRLVITVFDLSEGLTVSDIAMKTSMRNIEKASPSIGAFPADHAMREDRDIENVSLGSASVQLFDQRCVFRSGSLSLAVWQRQLCTKSLLCSNPNQEQQAQLIVELDEFLTPLYKEPPVSVAVKGDIRSKLSSLEKLDPEKASDSPPLDSSPVGRGERQDRSPSEKRKLWILDKMKWGVASGQVVDPGSMEGPDHAPSSIGIPKTVSPVTAQVLQMDPLQAAHMTPRERSALWQDREKLLDMPQVLPRVLCAVDWLNEEQRSEAIRILAEWRPPSPMQALELLDCVQGEFAVREYAVRCLEPAGDDELCEMLIQLTQVLKYEPYHESPLALFLLRRAWMSPIEVGTRFFWSLRAEMHQTKYMQRFGLLLHTYLDNSSSSHLQDLSQQVDVQNLLQEVAKGVHKHKFTSKVERLRFVRRELTKVNEQLPGSFQLCLEPQIVVSDMVVSKCKVMNSKKKPLWLKFNSIDPQEGGGSPVQVMFKFGDDLRQDQMTLQMLRIMDQIWLAEGLDLNMTLYRCISTGDELGMLEIVSNADTIANIQKQHGKLGALSSRSLYMWLQDCNPGQQFDRVVSNFVHSCAGYCVATYVLGIGDRHSDNIMIKRDGRLFHIDFGHFLGNFKSKFGVKRERHPFVFTKEMAFVMGGRSDKTFRKFVELCCRAFNILRRQATAIITLFKLMIPAQMPELTCESDIQYLCDKLALDQTDKQAAETFKREINNSLNDTLRRVDNLFHNIKTG